MTNRLKMKDIAYNVIKNKILSNEFSSGQYLEEKMLCELVGVSRTPIREAVNQLQNEGFLNVQANKGIFVTTIDLISAKELFQARLLLEPMMLEIGWNNLDSETIQDFKEKTIKFLESDDFQALNELDYEFHNYLNASAKNNYLTDILNRLQDQFQRIRTLDFNRVERILGGAKEHLEIFESFENSDLERTKELLISHIQSTQSFFYQSFLNG